MQSTLSLELHETLARYLRGQISVSEFGKQLAAMTWDIEEQEDSALVDLLHGLELGLAEFDNGDWTEQELKALFHRLIEESSIKASAAP